MFGELHFQRVLEQANTLTHTDTHTLTHTEEEEPTGRWVECQGVKIEDESDFGGRQD